MGKHTSPIGKTWNNLSQVCGITVAPVGHVIRAHCRLCQFHSAERPEADGKMCIAETGQVQGADKITGEGIKRRSEESNGEVFGVIGFPTLIPGLI